MSKKPNPIPEGQDTAVPYLCAHDAAEALAFYAKAFGAVETMRMAGPDGRVGHAEFRIGRATFMLSDEHPELSSARAHAQGVICGHAPLRRGRRRTRPPGRESGAALVRPIKDEFYGDRSAVLTDPFGHRWFLASRIEEVSAEELQRRHDAMTKDT